MAASLLFGGFKGGYGMVFASILGATIDEMVKWSPGKSPVRSSRDLTGGGTGCALGSSSPSASLADGQDTSVDISSQFRAIACDTECSDKTPLGSASPPNRGKSSTAFSSATLSLSTHVSTQSGGFLGNTCISDETRHLPAPQGRPTEGYSTTAFGAQRLFQ